MMNARDKGRKCQEKDQLNIQCNRMDEDAASIACFKPEKNNLSRSEEAQDMAEKGTTMTSELSGLRA